MQPSNSQQRLLVLAVIAWSLCTPLFFGYRWLHSTNADDAFIYRTGVFVMIPLIAALALARYMGRNRRNYPAELMTERRP